MPHHAYTHAVTWLRIIGDWSINIPPGIEALLHLSLGIACRQELELSAASMEELRYVSTIVLVWSRHAQSKLFAHVQLCSCELACRSAMCFS